MLEVDFVVGLGQAEARRRFQGTTTGFVEFADQGLEIGNSHGVLLIVAVELNGV